MAENIDSASKGGHYWLFVKQRWRPNNVSLPMTIVDA